jgi:hypothetical protein
MGKKDEDEYVVDGWEPRHNTEEPQKKWCYRKKEGEAQELPVRSYERAIRPKDSSGNSTLWGSQQAVIGLGHMSIQLDSCLSIRMAV